MTQSTEERARRAGSRRLGSDSYTDICGRLGLRPEQAHKLFHQAKAQLKTCVEGALG